MSSFKFVNATVMLCAVLTIAVGCEDFDDNLGDLGDEGLDTFANDTPNASGAVKCATAKEHSKASLSCSGGDTISQIMFASYGTPDGTCNSGFTQSSCHAGSSKSKVKASCLGKQSCSVSATNATFGDPCPGTFKRLRILYSCSGGMKNVALGRTTRQSSTAYGGVSSRAVDGNTNGNWGAGSITHTARAAASWWKVDLGGAHRLERVTLWNRTNCCSDRLSNFHVDYLGQNGNVIATKTHPGQAAAKTEIVLAGQDVYAVRVGLNGTNFLSLAEVQVWGTPGQGVDLCPDDPNKTVPGECGCGVAEGTCQCKLDLGHTDYCKECGPCDEGEGDCDSDSHCRGDLVCVQQDGVDYCREKDDDDDDDDGPHLQVKVGGVWKGVDCGGNNPRVSNSFHKWDLSARVLTHRSGKKLKCPEGRKGEECTCSGSGERMHGGYSRGSGDVKDNLEKSGGGPIFPDADSGHHFLCLKFSGSRLIQVDVRDDDCNYFRYR